LGLVPEEKKTCFRESLELSLPLDGGELIILVVTLLLLKSQYTCHAVSNEGKIIYKKIHTPRRRAKFVLNLLIL
jgi:hypothetical protein